ncbi:hypothetical protein HPB50_027104 [Hyalomma asiaticum]|uniref:Uncharacterized protein n=1 Tax=Hyalomma asiaticum TaxID=266040 RepID=A0ACB7T0A9_HYAAI|nr:hypothetical protein HPB50_028861 [Hyalomma asiaticum]KAH6940373.1 hypothetical protein HPB50_027104 [Hyalomma asiaticum]
MLHIDDPFIAKSSDDDVQLLRTNDKGFSACSIDVKDLYYYRAVQPATSMEEWWCEAKDRIQ